MTEQRIYHLKQIVWAKIDSYPWWPGKVTGAVLHNRKKIYKINFFADPTYCHLFSQALSPFCQQPPSYEKFRHSDLKLRKAIQMANKFISKNQARLLQEIDNDVSPAQKIMHQPLAFQETKLQSKHEIELTQKMLDNEPSYQRQNDFISIQQLLSAEVNETNIIEILNSKMVSQLTKQKGYSQRKLAFSLIEKLKYTLLSRYSLNNIDTFYPKKKNISSQSIQNSQQQKKLEQKNNNFLQNKITKHSNILKFHRLKKYRKGHKHHNHNTQTLCVRKIYNILKRRNFISMEAKDLSIRLIKYLMYKQNVQNEKISQEFKKSFLDLISWLKNASQKSNVIQNQNVLENYMEFYVINKNKGSMFKIDEQKSWATSIPAMEQ